MNNQYGIDSKMLDYLMKKRRPEVEPLPAPTGQLISSLADASASLGTLGGQKADTSSVARMGETVDKYALENQRRQQDFAQKEDERQLAIASLLDKYKQKNDAQILAAKNQDKALKDEKDLAKYKSNLKTQQAIKLSETKPKKNIGRDAIDKGFAKEYVNFVKGGKANAAMSINRLSGYIDELESEKDKIMGAGGGAIATTLPDWLRSRKSIKLRDDITGVAMQGLKDIFGGQISDGERKSLAATFYNDALPPEENIKILKRKLTELERGYQSKIDMVNYFEANNGSLEGYEGISTDDYLANLRTQDPNYNSGETYQAQPGTAYAGEEKSTKKYKTGDTAIGADGIKKIKNKDGFWVPHDESNALILDNKSMRPKQKSGWDIGEETVKNGKTWIKKQDGKWYPKGN